MTEQSSETIRVILADDHAIVRTGIRQFLERSGDIQVVAEADDGRQALQLIEELHPDVAVLDIQMPHCSGIDVARQVRLNRLQVGVLILTAYEDDPYIDAVLKAGANGYVLKTATPAEIVRAVREVYHGKSVLDDVVLAKVMAQVSSSSPNSMIAPLTDREMEILSLAARGLTNRSIGTQLDISDRTIQGHIARIFEKLQASSRTEAVMRAVSLGWLPADLGSQAHAL
jgi:DNA-binding NarL/FixJ family response regulator